MGKRKLRELRKLTLDECKFSYTVELDQDPVEINTDDSEFDRLLEREIQASLNRGYVEAWCTVVVTLEWNGFTGTSEVGGCSFPVGKTGPECAKDVLEYIDKSDLRQEALDELNHALERTNETLHKLAS